MTVSTFKSMQEFINCISKTDFAPGEKYATSVMPSALFSKHYLTDFFSVFDRYPHGKEMASELWEYGRRFLSALRKGDLTICLEWVSLENFVIRGLVHSSNLDFEVSFAERVHVLRTLRPFVASQSCLFTDSVPPYLFRLHPPHSVILDIERNYPDQSIQGLLIEEPETYSNFETEFERLVQSASAPDYREARIGWIDGAIAALLSGNLPPPYAVFAKAGLSARKTSK